MENQSFVDRSDFLALRSVDEAEEGKEAEVGGISNIPMFSSSEEKLLEYNSLQVNQCCQLFLTKYCLKSKKGQLFPKIQRVLIEKKVRKKWL